MTGKVAIITGGSNGIGKAYSKMLANAGAFVEVSDLKLADAQKVADNIITYCRNAIALECNVTEDSHPGKLVNKTIEKYGKINYHVNNAGGGGMENPLKIPVGISVDISAAYIGISVSKEVIRK